MVPRTLARPVPFPVGSRFGEPRNNAVGFHVGADYPCPTGTYIRAAHDGIVVWTRAGSFNADTAYGGYGNNVWIEDPAHAFGTVYCHMKGIGIQIGDRVARGATIGTVGNTGISTGPHLHFEVRAGLHLALAKYGAVLDPELYFGKEIDVNQEQQFSIVVLADVIKAAASKWPPDLTEAQRVILREIAKKSV